MILKKGKEEKIEKIKENLVWLKNHMQIANLLFIKYYINIQKMIQINLF